MKLLLLVLLIPSLVFSQQSKRGSYIGQEYDSTNDVWMFIRKDFPPTSATRQNFYWVKGMRSFVIFTDSLRMYRYRGANHGSIDTLAWFSDGFVRQSPASQLDVSKLGGTFPMGRVTGTYGGSVATSQLTGLIPYSQMTGAYTGNINTSQLMGTIPIGSITGNLPISQTIGDLPVSRLSGTIMASAYTGTLPFTSITGVATLAQLPTIPLSQTSGSYTGSIATSQLTGSIPFASVTSGRAATFPTRTFGTAFTPSATRDVFVKYTCSITATMSLTGGQSGVIYLETSTNGTTWVEVDRMVNSNSGALTIGLNIVQSQTGGLSAVVTAGSQVRVRSTGTATNVLVSSIETIL